MKIGILTFHRAINYGAVLQAYALQKYLVNKNIKVDIIDYRSRVIEESYKPFYYTLTRKNIRSLISDIIKLPIRVKKKNGFNKFLNREFSLSKSMNKSDLIDIVDKYDLFITGSDQVWNLDITGEDYTYFLDFIQDKYKKASYAASLGNFNLVNKKETKALLEDFKYISIREESKKNIIEGYINKNVDVSLDPTLLLSKNEWGKIAIDTKKNEEYLLLYTVDKPVKLIDYARRIAREKNLKIIYITEYFERDSDIEYVRDASPEEFLGYFKNANMVLTNSFHGTVFSILFEKCFYVELQGQKKYNDRSENLLKNLGLQNRAIKDSESISSEKIDWNIVNKKLKIKCEDSYNYINNLIIY